MGALEAGDVVVVAAEHVGGRREPLEILGGERSHPVGAHERLVGVRPAVAAGVHALS